MTSSCSASSDEDGADQKDLRGEGYEPGRGVFDDAHGVLLSVAGAVSLPKRM
jgi:hypothetical protein